MDHDAPAHPILRLSVRCFVCSHECRQMPALLYDPWPVAAKRFDRFYLPLTLRLYNCHDIIPSICLLEVFVKYAKISSAHKQRYYLALRYYFYAIICQGNSTRFSKAQNKQRARCLALDYARCYSEKFNNDPDKSKR